MPFTRGKIFFILSVTLFLLVTLHASAQTGNAGAVRGTVTDRGQRHAPDTKGRVQVPGAGQRRRGEARRPEQADRKGHSCQR